ncbi:unnamed protein product [Scytosiphon promiscuus]
MTVRVRLQRLGRRNKPFYRVVVADSRSPRDGKFIELVGTYNPLATRSGVKEVTFKVDRIRYWISVGAQPSDRVAWLLGQFGILPPKVVPVARTKQIMPRKEWKELKKQQAAGEGKGFHTSAACAQPALCGSGCGSEQFKGILQGRSSEVTHAGSEADQTAAGWQQQQRQQQSPVSGGLSGSVLPLVETGRLSFGWGTGQAFVAKRSHSGSNAAPSDAQASGASDELGNGVAAALSRMSLSGSDRPQQQQQRTWPAFSPLRTVLASHLSLLGPSACSTIGLGTNPEGRPENARWQGLRSGVEESSGSGSVSA